MYVVVVSGSEVLVGWRLGGEEEEGGRVGYFCLIIFRWKGF